MTKEKFYENFNDKIIHQFEHEGFIFVIYTLSDNNVFYITGEKYSWEIGLQYSEEIGHIVSVYHIDESLKRAITRELRKI